jgi:L-serine/L-threonine ammonia-lyase
MISQPLYIETPLLLSEPLSRFTGRNLFLKLESLQPSGSFKNRGIGNFCYQAVKGGAEAFVSSSGGNAGLACSYAAKILHKPLTVVVPTSTSTSMVEKILEQGAEVRQVGADWQEADRFARSLCDATKACYVSPFDHEEIWSGNATIVHEIANSSCKPDAIVLSVGGGGLFCGIMQGLHDVGWGHVPVFTVETKGAASLHAAVQNNKVIALDKIDTVAKSLGARAVCQEALSWTRKHKVLTKVVSDQDTLDACDVFARDHRLIVEPACGATLSLCYNKDQELLRYHNIVAIVCGGSCV